MFITMYTLYIDPFQNSSINCHKHYAIPDMLARVVRTSENTVHRKGNVERKLVIISPFKR